MRFPMWKVGLKIIEILFYIVIGCAIFVMVILTIRERF